MDGKPIYTLSQVMEWELPPIVLLAAPIMVILVFVEYYVLTRKMQKNYDGKDVFAAALVGIGNLIVNALSKVVMFGIVLLFYNISPFYFPQEYFWWSLIPCIIILDFFRYWAHRYAHEWRFLWSTHIVHHSSEQYNWSVGFRLSWFQHVKVVFFLPVALMGFDPFIFFVAQQIEVMYQFWIHTEMITKLPKPIEFLFTTPSHHRVHHAKNEKYLDKNYGSTFIIWDRIFGTFQPEEETPQYGILKPVNSYNPIYLVFHELVDFFRDLFRIRSAKEFWTVIMESPNQKLARYHEQGLDVPEGLKEEFVDAKK